MPLPRELGEQLRAVEQIVDVGRVEDPVLAEREVVDPTFVGDRTRVRLHDRACPRRPAELERDDGLAGVAGDADAGEEVRRTTEGLDDDADDRGERIGRRDGDEVGQVADGLVTGRDHDRHAERSFPGGRSRGPGEEPALGDDAHAANRRGAGNRQVEPPTGEEAHAEGDVAEPGAVRTDDGEGRPVGDGHQPLLGLDTIRARLRETGCDHDHAAASQRGSLLHDGEGDLGVDDRQHGVDRPPRRGEVDHDRAPVGLVASGVDQDDVMARFQHRQDDVVRHRRLIVRANDGDRLGRQHPGEVAAQVAPWLIHAGHREARRSLTARHTHVDVPPVHQLQRSEGRRGAGGIDSTYRRP